MVAIKSSSSKHPPRILMVILVVVFVTNVILTVVDMLERKHLERQVEDLRKGLEDLEKRLRPQEWKRDNESPPDGLLGIDESEGTSDLEEER